MKILGIMNKTSGCGYHRVIMPLGFMEDVTGYVTNHLTEDKMEGWDMMLYNRLSPFDLNWQKTKDLLECKIVMDIDDYWNLPPNHINYNHYEEFGKRIENNITTADMVTVTNEALAIKCRQYSDNVHIFPNALPFGRNQFTPEKRESERVRIFWCGGATHEEDLKMLRGPINKLKMHQHKIQMILGGYTDTDKDSKQIWDKMFSYFTAGGQLPYAKLHGTEPNNYMQMYENADIMLIPLEGSEWHGCKSNLKILEAASKRIPCIVSNVSPYNLDSDAPVLWVNNQRDWFEHLNYLILNPIARQELGNKLYEWAKKNYSIETVNIGRRIAFAHLCSA